MQKKKKKEISSSVRIKMEFLPTPPHPQNTLEVLTPVPVNATSCGNKDFADDQINMRSLGWVLTHMTGALIKRGSLDTDTYMGRRKTM